jgi:hypothetical protein
LGPTTAVPIFSASLLAGPCLPRYVSEYSLLFAKPPLGLTFEGRKAFVNVDSRVLSMVMRLGSAVSLF